MFRQIKTKGFDLKPRYYDADKERRNKILRKGEEEIPFGDSKKYGERLREKWEQKRTTATKDNFATRIMVILVILAGLIYLFFKWF